MSKLKIPLPIGYTAEGFQEVLNVFRESFTKGVDKGASFAAYYKGEPVVHLWGGIADEQVKRSWKADTMGLFHSTTKFVAGVTIAHMIERNLLSYNEKICKYWPEFAQNGKENITLEMLLSYTAGLPALSETIELRWVRDDPQRLHNVLVKQRPFWTPGEKVGYHPMTVGLYLNEIVKRVDKKGRTLSQYYKDEIAGPFGIDFHNGLPKHLYHRVVRLEPRNMSQAELEEKMNSFKGDPSLYQLVFTRQAKDWVSPRSLNDPDFLELPVSSSHGVGTSLSMAKFSGIVANGGQHEGKTLLTPQSIAKLQEPVSFGRDLVTSGTEINGRGAWLIPVVEGDKTWFMFGHAGYGDQCSAADPHYKVGWAYTTNYINPGVQSPNNKWRPLLKALFECIHRLEGVHVERRLLNSYEELELEKRHQMDKSKL